MLFRGVMAKVKGKWFALGGAGAASLVIIVAAWLVWPQVSFWRAFAQLGGNLQGFSEYRHRATGIIFVGLPGGRFLMGAQTKDSERPNYDPEARPFEGPVHEVELRPFLIAKYEVTHAEWERVMGSRSVQGEADRQPARGVSWSDCRLFCEGTGLRFPSEAQWEYACRGGTRGVHAGTGGLDRLAWHDGTSGGKTQPVGTKEPNGFGLHDLHGNVSEWCADAFDPGFYALPEAAGPDPVCSGAPGDRVDRGGSAFQGTDRCRSAARASGKESDREGDLGFRPAFFPLP
jgi:formylglycine-generating enzyme required for sulfatase activity